MRLLDGSKLTSLFNIGRSVDRVRTTMPSIDVPLSTY